MPISNDSLARLTKHVSDVSSLRTVIFNDHAKTYLAYAHFDTPYDKDESLTAVKAYFDTSFAKLQTSLQPVFTSEELPIVDYLGKWQVTLVTKSIDGAIMVSDATDKPVDAYIALER